MNKLIVRNLTFSYPNKDNLFENLNFEAKEGDIILIEGKNGAGKSTLLKIFCGVIPKIIKGNLSGKIIVNNKNIENISLPQMAKYMGFMMQYADKQLIFPEVENELAFAPENLCLDKMEIKKRIEFALGLINIHYLIHKKTTTLSYGEKKLVVFASILTLFPPIYLLDEPLAGLSEKYRNIILKTLEYLSVSGKIIFITDHLQKVKNIANKTIIL